MRTQNLKRPRLLIAVTTSWLLWIPAAIEAGEATLYRDNWGVPHIWADDFASAGYAVGQAQYEDSLENVLYCLHAGVGQLSRVFRSHMMEVDIDIRDVPWTREQVESVAESKTQFEYSP